MARAVSLFKSLGVINPNEADYLSLLGQSTCRQVLDALSDIVFNGYRQYIVHSFFNPYVLILLIAPLPLRIVLLPHGELKQDALRISADKKRIVLHLLRPFKSLNERLRKITMIASNSEELLVAKDFLGASRCHLLFDLVSREMPYGDGKNRNSTTGLNLINIARMVPNKGMARFLAEVRRSLQQANHKWIHQIDAIHFFYTSEDACELQRVQSLAFELASKYQIRIVLYGDLRPSEIAQMLTTLPNRMAFLSSKFESFSYALIESLGFEYKTMVWFNNELVENLAALDLCVPIKFGEIPSDQMMDEHHMLSNFTHAAQFLINAEEQSIHDYRQLLQNSLHG